MSAKVKYTVTSEHPCQIPVLGTFEAGETKEIDDNTVTSFETIFGYKLGSGKFPTWVSLTVALESEEVEQEDVTDETEEA